MRTKRRVERAGWVLLLVGALVTLAGVGASSFAAATDTTMAVRDPASTFAEQPIGAAAVAGVTGGTGGKVRVVSNLANDGPGSLRAAAEAEGPAIVIFSVSGQIPLRKPIAVSSNLTIDGRGVDITLVGKGLEIEGQKNVIVRNLRVRDSAESDSNDDAISIGTGSVGVWIDHTDLAGYEDGLIDVTQGATGVTLSWNRLAMHGKTMLLGSAVQEGTPPLVDITVHHNLYTGTGERNPMVRQAHAHVFNNVVEAWGYAADSGYGMRGDCGSILLVDSNMFLPSGNMRAVTVHDENCDPTRPPAVRMQANDLGGAAGAETLAATVGDLDPTPLPVEPVGPDLLAAVRSAAGWQQVPNPVPLPDPNAGTDASTESVASGSATSSGGSGSGGSFVTIALLVGAVGIAAGVTGLVVGRRRGGR